MHGGSVWPGIVVATLVAALVIGTLAAVALSADGMAGLRTGDAAILRFSIVQPLLSALLSVALAVPVARALARRRFCGRRALITLLGAPFILPVVVAVLGLLALFGRGGVLNAGLALIGLEPVSIYGFHGVVLANLFFNLPLATRLLLQGWRAIPGERFRLAASLGFGPRDIFRRLELPMLREVVPGAVLAIFLICLTSFAVALMLGGGPRATTLELAIYQAFRFEFDLGRAALLALIQFGLCAVAALALLRTALPAGFGAGMDRAAVRWDAGGAGLRIQDAAVLAATTLFLALPLALLILRGAPMLASLPAPVWQAAARSVVMALLSAGLCLAMGLVLAVAAQRFAALESVGMLALAASPMVIGTGLFLLTLPFADPQSLALPVTVLVSATLALPFVLRALIPAVRAVLADYGRLADSLALTGTARLRLLILPRLRRPLGFAGGLAAAAAMGDLGVVTLFASPDQATLPMQVFALMGAYRMALASGAAVLLLALSLGLFWLFDRGGRIDADA